MKSFCKTEIVEQGWISGLVDSATQLFQEPTNFLFPCPWQKECLPTNSRSPPKPMSIESVMPSSHLILSHPLLLLPSIYPSIRVFSNESALRMRWPKCWNFSFNISPSNEHPGLISFGMDWLDLLAVQGTLRVFSNTTVQKHQFFGTQLSL